ncbi:hypothetical protein HPE56_14775 [Maribacter sp. ANRC-HE7]|uniref:DUF4384 domain-containing protein n=1 Tax=Maribacter aquimaris TaxID=2737171 RepID=A0ABR7V6Z3_9FLAO|nr:hypothetical protein [Maribacter aquimaris]MBD0779061.1 hypothetical protein [Maribacter aquimaris]
MKISSWNRFTLIVAFGIVSVASYGQARLTVRQNGPNTELYFTKAVKAPSYNEVVGSPYLYEEFVPARVNDIDRTLFVRFNVYDNSIEFKGGDAIIYSMPKSNDYVIELLNGSNKVYETHEYVDDRKEIGNTFFEKVYSDDDFGLYLREIILFTPVKMAKNSFETNKPAKFKKGKVDFYFQQLDADSPTLLKLPKREKQFLKIFDEHSAAVKGFIKKEGLDWEETEDLIRFFQFYFAQ